jgi:hypothetical protein
VTSDVCKVVGGPSSEGITKTDPDDNLASDNEVRFRKVITKTDPRDNLECEDEVTCEVRSRLLFVRASVVIKSPKKSLRRCV